MTNQIAPPFHTATPDLIVSNAKEAIEFYKKAFNANEVYRFPAPDGKIMHALIKIGDSPIMLADEFPNMGAKSPLTIGGTAVTIHLYVEDADEIFSQAVAAGAKVTLPIEDAFWGDRYGKVVDPYGHSWAIATPQKSLTTEELRKAGEEFFANMPKQ